MRTPISLLLLVASLASVPASASPSPLGAADDFRNVYAGILAGKYSPDDIEKLIYFPTGDVANPPQAAKTASQFFHTLQVRYSMHNKGFPIDPLELYEEGRRRALHPVAISESEAAIRKLGGLTIVLVPGIFGEFIKTHAFEEVFRESSPDRERFLARLAKARNAGSPDVFDKQFSLQKLASRDVPLDQLFRVGTLNGSDGAPLAQVVIFHAEKYSLESMSKDSDVAAIFNERLRKLFAIAGTPKNILFLGYSRGAPLELEMLTQAAAANAPWLSRVIGVSTLGGVIYGSDLADVALGRWGDTPLTRQLSLLKDLRSSLQTLEDSSSPGAIARNAVTKVRNTEAWLKFFGGMLQLNLPNQPLDSSLDLAALKAKMDGLLSTFRVEKGINLKSIIAEAVDAGFHELEVLSPSQYSANIEKFDRLVDGALDGLNGLSTSARMNWWRNHEIPVGTADRPIRYYSIEATMADPKSSDAEERDLAKNPVSYRPSLPDFGSLVKNYEEFLAFTGLALNDSQVAAHKARFWPEAESLLRPSQPPFESKYLGILGVHHWGLALEIVTEVNSGAKDPYPRAALLEAIAAKAARDSLGLSKE